MITQVWYWLGYLSATSAPVNVLFYGNYMTLPHLSGPACYIHKPSREELTVGRNYLDTF